MTKEEKVLLDVYYVGMDNKQHNHQAKVTPDDLKGYALFCNMVLNNSINLGKEFSINVQIENNETVSSRKSKKTEK